MTEGVELWIVRHAEAEERSLGRPDAARALTARGRRQAARLARAFRALDVELDALHHSPLLRALETADALAPLARGTVVSARLATEPGPELLAALAVSDGPRLAVVGHEPWLSQLAFWLVTGWSLNDPERQPAWTELGKGSALRLRGPLAPGRMRLELALDAPALRRLGKR